MEGGMRAELVFIMSSKLSDVRLNMSCCQGVLKASRGKIMEAQKKRESK